MFWGDNPNYLFVTWVIQFYDPHFPSIRGGQGSALRRESPGQRLFLLMGNSSKIEEAVECLSLEVRLVMACGRSSGRNGNPKTWIYHGFIV